MFALAYVPRLIDSCRWTLAVERRKCRRHSQNIDYGSTDADRFSAVLRIRADLEKSQNEKVSEYECGSVNGNE
jgi:hypothetical protein